MRIGFPEASAAKLLFIALGEVNAMSSDWLKHNKTTNKLMDVLNSPLRNLI